MTELICITCPKGCHLRVDEEKGFAVTGNSCPRGAEYGRNESQPMHRCMWEMYWRLIFWVQM